VRFAFLTVGTRGDTQPYVALASELTRRGHEVVLSATEDMAAFVQKAGIEAVPYKGMRMRELFDSPQGQAFLARGQLVRFVRWMRSVQAQSERAVLDAVVQATERADVIVSHPLTEVGARALARWKRVPLLRTQLAPVIPTRAFPSPLLNLGRVPFAALRHGSHRLAREVIWREERSTHLEACRVLGLEPATRNPHVLLEEERVPCAHLVSPTLLPRPSDWPPYHVMTGHCGLPASLRERIGEGPLEPALERWLGAGPPPVYFGFGSMPILDPPAFTGLVREVIEALGVRGLVVAGWTQLKGLAGDDRLFLAQALNHDEVLPRCQAAVHHGGLGTTTATLAAGLPTLVCSVVLDQPFWGTRVQELGAGAWMPFPRLTAARLRKALEHLLSEPVKARAAELGARMRQERGLQHTADFLERHGQSQAGA
jgi:UDP:flavonoid glycosyltransferase YjiC (YdhE family)